MRRILVKEVNWLGDLVISLPALQALRRAFPEARLAILIKRELAGFFDGASWVDEVIPYHFRPGAAGLADRMALVRVLRPWRFDLGIALPRSFESAFLLALLGAARRVGVAADMRSWLLTDAVPIDTRNPERHQAYGYLDLLERTLGITGDVADVQLAADPQHRAAMREWLAARRRLPGKLIALAPAAAYGPAKQWPATHFAALIDLLAESAIESVVVGAPQEREACLAVAAASRHGSIVAAGATGIGELIGLLSLCDGFIGNDSGAMHVAAGLGIPTVGIFGSTNPRRTGPLGRRAQVLYQPPDCSPCLQRTCRFGHYDCLRLIEPQAALGALATLGAL